MRRVVSLALLALAACVPVARATVGGETLCEMLGWDAGAKRVYLHEHDGGGGDSFGRIVYFALEGEEAGRLRAVAWNRTGEGTADDRDLAARLDSLRARLVPLRPAVWQTLPLRTELVASDSVPNPVGVERRLRIRVSFGGDLDFEVTAWGSTLVTRPAAFAIPGRREQVWVLAFVGDAFEVGYETQVPVLVRPGEKATRRIEWRGGGE